MNTLQFTDEELDRFVTALFHAIRLLDRVADAAELRKLRDKFLEASVGRNLDEDNTPAPRTSRR